MFVACESLQSRVHLSLSDRHLRKQIPILFLWLFHYLIGAKGYRKYASLFQLLYGASILYVDCKVSSSAILSETAVNWHKME